MRARHRLASVVIGWACLVCVGCGASHQNEDELELDASLADAAVASHDASVSRDAAASHDASVDAQVDAAPDASDPRFAFCGRFIEAVSAVYERCCTRESPEDVARYAVRLEPECDRMLDNDTWSTSLVSFDEDAADGVIASLEAMRASCPLARPGLLGLPELIDDVIVGTLAEGARCAERPYDADPRRDACAPGLSCQFRYGEGEVQGEGDEFVCLPALGLGDECNFYDADCGPNAFCGDGGCAAYVRGGGACFYDEECASGVCLEDVGDDGTESLCASETANRFYCPAAG